MRKLGYLLLVLGLVGILGSFAFPVTVENLAAHESLLASIRGMTEDEARPIIAEMVSMPTATVNLDKLALRMMLEVASAAVMIAGAVLTLRAPDRPASPPTPAS
jgi:hypothetical protein